MSNLTLAVTDANGTPLTDAVVDVQMTAHAFQFGTQVHDRLLTITESEFNALTTSQKHGLIGDWDQSETTPTWQDTENYRSAVYDNFNHIIPTNGMQWATYRGTGPTYLDRTIAEAQSRGMTVTGHSVVWQNDGWPTPTEFRPGSAPDPQVFYDALIDERLDDSSIVTRFSDAGAGPTVTDWDVLNEPLHETYYSNTFVGAGIYANAKAAFADYFRRVDAQRPDAELAINDYNILSAGNDNSAIAYRNLVNDLLALGAPIDRIKVQAHMDRAITKAAATRRLNILAETGLPITISEFDMRDDSGQLTPAQQEQLFRDMLEAAFENESVDAFNMWGFWDTAHWRGNGPLYNADWTFKTEAAPWRELVLGAWMTSLDHQALDGSGMWSGDVVDGIYDFTVDVNAQTYFFSGYDVTDPSTFTLQISAVPEPSTVILAVLGLSGLCVRRRRK